MQLVTSRFLQIEEELGCFLFDTFECNIVVLTLLGINCDVELKDDGVEQFHPCFCCTCCIYYAFTCSTIACISTLFIIVHVVASVTSTTLFASSFALTIDNSEQNCMHMYSDAPFI